jgi:hypothetical protein
MRTARAMSPPPIQIILRESVMLSPPSPTNTAEAGQRLLRGVEGCVNRSGALPRMPMPAARRVEEGPSDEARVLSGTIQRSPMELNLSIDYEVKDSNPEVEAALEDIIAEEARSFAETIRRRLATEGVADINMNLTENPK